MTFWLVFYLTPHNIASVLEMPAKEEEQLPPQRAFQFNMLRSIGKALHDPISFSHLTELEIILATDVFSIDENCEMIESFAWQAMSPFLERGLVKIRKATCVSRLRLLLPRLTRRRTGRHKILSS